MQRVSHPLIGEGHVLIQLMGLAVQGEDASVDAVGDTPDGAAEVGLWAEVVSTAVEAQHHLRSQALCQIYKRSQNSQPKKGV